MIIILGIIGLVVAHLIWGFARRKPFVREYPDGFGVMSVIFWVILFIFLVATVCSWQDSYKTNLALNAHYKAVMAEYGDAVTYYKDTVVVDTSAVTDFRYAEVGKLLRDLRDKTAWYNEKLIVKRLKKQNPLIDWFVIAPYPELKLIRLKNLLKAPGGGGK